MSGHSHWAGIKYKKGIADAKKGKAFSKVTREITIAAKEGGDPLTNSKLKMAIEKAKTLNMPKENIEKAIKRGTGELAGEKLEEVIFEAYGPGKIAIIIEGITDNKNRSLGEIKQILSQNNGKLVEEGSVKWLFERKGCIVLDLKSQTEDFKNKERIEMAAIDLGAQDLYWHNNLLDVYTKTEELEKIKKDLEEKGVKVESASLGWAAKDVISLDKKDEEACQKLFEALDENEAVQEIYSNLKI